MYMANTYFGHIHILNEPNIAKRQNILWAAGVSVFVGGENSNNKKKKQWQSDCSDLEEMTITGKEELFLC